MAFQLGECLLLDLLKKRNMSQAEFARRLGVSKQFVHKLITREKVMSLEFAINAAFVLQCRVTDFYVLSTNSNR